MTELDGKVAFVTGASRGVGAAVSRRPADAGTLHTARATLPHLVAAGGGDLLSLASVAGLRGSRPEGEDRAG